MLHTEKCFNISHNILRTGDLLTLLLMAVRPFLLYKNLFKKLLFF